LKKRELKRQPTLMRSLERKVELKKKKEVKKDLISFGKGALLRQA
jgi:hypothetical protein